jgi:hypothetical protein
VVVNITKDGVLISQTRLDKLVMTQAATGDGSVIPTFQAVNGVIVSDTSQAGNDFLFGSAKMNRESSVAETKFFFDHSEQAFRTGIVNTDAWNTTNLGEASFAAGRDTKAKGDASAAFGEGTAALSYAEVAIGSYNTIVAPNSATTVNANDRAFVVGNGDSDNRSDALVLYKNGNLVIAGSLSSDNLTFPSAAPTAAGQVLTATNTSGATAWQEAEVNTDGTTITGDGTTGNEITLNLGNANTWTAKQTVSDTLQATTLGTDTYTLPTAAATATGQVLVATNTTGATAWADQSTATLTDGTTITGDGTTGNEITLNLGNANTWTAKQTVSDTLQATTLGTDTYTLPTAAATATGQVLVATNTTGTTAWADPSSAVLTDGTTITGDGTTTNKIALNLGNANTWTANQTFGDSVILSNYTGSVRLLSVDKDGLITANSNATAREAAGMYSGVFTVTTAGSIQTVGNANLTASSVIIVTLQGTTQATYRITTITPGTEFVLEFSNALQNGDKIHYMIINN